MTGATRRRGAALEEALLEAAWDELKEAGYASLTMDGVAKRAATSRAVLYRRWSTKPDLVLDAVRHHIAREHLEVPDTGSLRDDLIVMLRQMSDRFGDLIGMFSLLTADFSAEKGEHLPLGEMRHRLFGGRLDRMDAVLRQPAERGEVDLDRLPPRVAALPFDLVRHHLLVNQAPVSGEEIEEIVDQLFLPLIPRPR